MRGASDARKSSTRSFERHSTHATRDGSKRSSAHAAKSSSRTAAPASVSRRSHAVSRSSRAMAPVSASRRSHGSRHSAVASAGPAPVEPRIPSTSPPGALNENQQRLVYEWLKPNIEYLLRAAALDQGFELSHIWTRRCCHTKDDCLRIVSAVCADEGVRRFFCFPTVSNAAFHELRRMLRGSAARRRMCVECGRNANCCGHRTVMRTGRSTLRHQPLLQQIQIAASEGSVKHYIGNVRAKIAGSESEYWRIINEASILDHGDHQLREYIKIVTKPFMKNKNEVKRRELAKSLDSKTLLGCRQSQKFNEEYNKIKRSWVESMHQIDSRLLAKWSISHAVATRLGTYPCTDNLYLCRISETDRCHAFWNARFLFAGKWSDAYFKGVALDTVLAKVWNADMQLRETHASDVYSCGRWHWRCTLSRVTHERWNQYVAPHDYSLPAFDDDSTWRFRPQEHIHLSCINCYEALKERSVLLNPL